MGWFPITPRGGVKFSNLGVTNIADLVVLEKETSYPSADMFGWLPGYAPDNGQNMKQAGDFCGAKGMRLATLDEGLAIAKAGAYCWQAFPEGVKSISSTYVDAYKDTAWFFTSTVDSFNHQMKVNITSDVRVICVK